MEYPAGIATAITVAKVALGALVLLPPLDMGFVGLAGVSLVMNIVQVIWLYIVLRAEGALPEPSEARSCAARTAAAGGAPSATLGAEPRPRPGRCSATCSASPAR